LGRVRKALKSGFLDYSPEDIEYLRRFGEWEDIPLLVELLDRRDSSPNTFLTEKSQSKQTNIAEAIYEIGRKRVSELLVTALPPVLLAHIIAFMSTQVFCKIDDSLINLLLNNENDIVRKAIALKCVGALSKSRIKRILEEYLSAEPYFYNVIHWLDLGVSAPRDVAIRAVKKLLKRNWNL